MKRLNRSLTTATLLLTVSCSTVQPVYERTPASLFDSCKNAITGFFGGGEKNKTTKVAQKATADADRSYVINNHKNNTFTTGRSLGQYLIAFNRPGYPTLALQKDLERIKMNPNGHWLDAGGGMGYATQEATKPGTKFKSTLVSVDTEAEDILDDQSNAVRRKVIKGKFIEDIADEEMPKSDLITDLYGPMAYTSHPDQVLRKYVDNLKSDGVAYIYLGEELDMFGANNQIITRDGKLYNFTEWLEAIPGIKTEIVKVDTFFPDTFIIRGEKSRVAKISLTKPASEIQIPELERLVFEEGGPMDGFVVPRMIFKETKFVKAPELPQNTGVDNSLKKLITDFRTGQIEHPLLDAIDDLNGGEWAHFSNQEIDWSKLPQVKMDEDNYLDISTNRILNRFKEISNKQLYPQVTSANALSGKKSVTLISDHNGTLISAGRPDKTLKLYLESLQDDGVIVLNMGDDKLGYSRAKILTKDGTYISFKKWLGEVPGLSVKFKRTTQSEVVVRKKLIVDSDRIDINGPAEDLVGNENAYGELAIIKIKDRTQISIPALNYLGKSKRNSRGFELPIYSQ